MAEHPDFALPRSIGATRSDGDGNFEARGLPDGLYSVKASRPQAVDLPPAFASATETAVAPGETVEIVLPALGGVRGRVVYESRKPVTSFGVALAAFTKQDAADLVQPAHRFTSADGTFRLANVPAGAYRVRIQGDDFVEVVFPDAVTVAAGPAIDLGTISVAKGTRRKGVVLSKAGEPVDTAQITVEVPDRPGQVMLETDADGRFSLPPTAPGITLRVRADKGDATSDWIEVAPGAGALELVLAKEGLGAVSGVIIESGAPLDNRVVVLTLVGGGTPGDTLRTFRTATTQSGGTFRLDDVPAGEYLIWVRRASRVREVDGDVWWKPEEPILVEPQRATQVVLPVPPRADGAAPDLPPGGEGQGQGGTR
jgi:hypothetical protein